MVEYQSAHIPGMLKSGSIFAALLPAGARLDGTIVPRRVPR
jgi:hypothetical protein